MKMEEWVLKLPAKEQYSGMSLKNLTRNTELWYYVANYSELNRNYERNLTTEIDFNIYCFKFSDIFCNLLYSAKAIFFSMQQNRTETFGPILVLYNNNNTPCKKINNWVCFFRVNTHTTWLQYDHLPYHLNTVNIFIYIPVFILGTFISYIVCFCTYNQADTGQLLLSGNTFLLGLLSFRFIFLKVHYSDPFYIDIE